ncbi:hypothetical protein [Nostoc sp. FACHB-892]|nr:hypothetical protein [Nostoc sp. FACHB-892]
MAYQNDPNSDIYDDPNFRNFALKIFKISENRSNIPQALTIFSYI